MKVEGEAPTFTLTRVVDTFCGEGLGMPEDVVVTDPCPSGEDGPIAYDVKGTMDVPCYLSTPACLPVHSHFVLDPTTNEPVQIPGNVMKVDFRCRIPKVALENPGEARKFVLTIRTCGHMTRDLPVLVSFTVVVKDQILFTCMHWLPRQTARVRRASFSRRGRCCSWPPRF